jgi:hypothetical protein
MRTSEYSRRCLATSLERLGAHVEVSIGTWLLLLGLGLALVVTVAWRNDLLTGLVGLAVSTSVATWLVLTIRALDARSEWGGSIVERDYYIALVGACVAAAVAGIWHVVTGVRQYLRLRRARVVASGDPATTETRICPHCGGSIPARAFVCKHCERDCYPRADDAIQTAAPAASRDANPSRRASTPR